MKTLLFLLLVTLAFADSYCHNMDFYRDTGEFYEARTIRVCEYSSGRATTVEQIGDATFTHSYTPAQWRAEKAVWPA